MFTQLFQGIQKMFKGGEEKGELTHAQMTVSFHISGKKQSLSTAVWAQQKQGQQIALKTQHNWIKHGFKENTATQRPPWISGDIIPKDKWLDAHVTYIKRKSSYETFCYISHVKFTVQLGWVGLDSHAGVSRGKESVTVPQQTKTTVTGNHEVTNKTPSICHSHTITHVLLTLHQCFIIHISQLTACVDTTRCAEK